MFSTGTLQQQIETTGLIDIYIVKMNNIIAYMWTMTVDLLIFFLFINSSSWYSNLNSDEQSSGIQRISIPVLLHNIIG